MTKVDFTEKEEHPSSFKSRREALGLSVDKMAASAQVDVSIVHELEATPADSGTYNTQAAFSISQALARAENP